jgi:hypothetical protein
VLLLTVKLSVEMDDMPVCGFTGADVL